jgi:hypothetical protein
VPNECWSELAVYGPRTCVLAFKASATGLGLGPFIASVADEVKLIKLIDSGVGIQRAAKLVETERGYKISAPLRRNYSRWKKEIRDRLAREEKTYASARRKALKNPNPLDLNQLLPLPSEVCARGTQEILCWRADNWGTKWNTWDVIVEPIRRLPEGMARLQYSFMTAWSEPIGAIARASKSHRALSFVLAGIDVSSSPDFTSHLICRGRVRTWRMPEKVWQKHAEMETDGENEYLASYQPRFMSALLEHWKKVVSSNATLIARARS